MVKKLKKKFIILATVSMFGLMAVLILVMNIINYSSVVRDCDEIINVLSQPNTPFLDEVIPQMPKEGLYNFIPRDMSPEVPFESRYFIALVSEDGEIIQTNVSKIVSVEEADVENYVEKVFQKKKTQGFVEQFRYSVSSSEVGIKIVFLDCGRKLDAFYSFMWTSIAIGFCGCVIVFLVFFFVAGRIIRPISESYEKQKRFITDAGHEIKTPLTVINANVDLLESEIPDSEELSDIRIQTKKLTDLTNNLVSLSRIEETEKIQKIEFPASELICEEAASFNALAASQNKKYIINVEPNVSLKGYPDDVRKLISVIVDNAMKYSPEGTEIELKSMTTKKYLIIVVTNQSYGSISDTDIANVFNRFYRTDSSRGMSIGGHGIGLSIAKAIVDKHGGKINAETKTGKEFCITVMLPI